jgi:hypothetical protein
MKAAVCIKAQTAAAEWSQVDIGYEGENVHQMAIDPTIPLVLYLSGSFGLLKSVDGGLNWNGAGVTERCHALALDPDNPGHRVYAATSNEPEPALFQNRECRRDLDKNLLIRHRQAADPDCQPG